MSKKQLSYIEAMSQIKEILGKLENESELIDMDVLLKEVENAAELLTFCKNKLDKSELKINKVLEDLEKDT